MPSKKRKAVDAAMAALPSIPKELIAHFANGSDKPRGRGDGVGGLQEGADRARAEW